MLPAYARRLSSNAEPIEIVPGEITNDVTVAVWFASITTTRTASGRLPSISQAAHYLTPVVIFGNSSFAAVDFEPIASVAKRILPPTAPCLSSHFGPGPRM
jgi:hypothetical protein